MSKYIGEFRSINGIGYKIEINSKNGNKTETVTLGENPFTVTAADNETIYEPVKTTGATITILTDKLPVDIYSGSVLGTSVKVISGTNVIWTGYLTPCAYTQGYDGPLEELELECVDGVSVLRDIPYTAESKSNTPFMDIIFNCLRKAKIFKTLYVADSVQFSASGTENVMSKIRVSEQNFFDEKDYAAQPDNEVAWSCFDVLTEVCKYMGYTITSNGEDVYIIDYDAIGTGRNRYFKYDISGNKIGTQSVVTLSHSHTITGNSIAETGNTITLTEIFNKLIVTDEFYKIHSVIPGLDEEKNLTNITAQYDTTLIDWMNSNSRFLESGVFTVDDETFFATITKNDSGELFFVVGKFFTNSMLTTYHYSNNNNAIQPDSDYNPMSYSKLWNGKGAWYYGVYVAPVESSKYNIWRANITSNWNAQDQKTKLNQFAELTHIANLQNVKLNYGIVGLNQDTNHIDQSDVKNFPYFKITKKIDTVFGGVDGYLMIKGDICRHNQYNIPVPSIRPSIHKDTKKTSIYANEGYVWAQLKWGDLYWKSDGNYNEQGSWSSSVSYFKLFYGDPTVEKRVESWHDKFISVYNTCNVWGVDDNGYYIPTPIGHNLEGTIELTIYANKDTKGKWARNNKKDKKNSYSGYPPKVMIYRNLDIVVGFADGRLLEDDANEDTCYTNEVSGYDNINEADEVEFKICTFDNKNPSYSTVDYIDSTGKSQYLDKTYNLVTGQTLRQEENYILKFVSQYEEPRVIYEVNLKNSLDFKPYSLLEYNQLPGNKFVIDSYTTDYRYDKTTLKIVEKNKTYA